MDIPALESSARLNTFSGKGIEWYTHMKLKMKGKVGNGKKRKKFINKSAFLFINHT
jgi:hypothetical protein